MVDLILKCREKTKNNFLEWHRRLKYFETNRLGQLMGKIAYILHRKHLNTPIKHGKEIWIHGAQEVQYINQI